MDAVVADLLPSDVDIPPADAYDRHHRRSIYDIDFIAGPILTDQLGRIGYAHFDLAIMTKKGRDLRPTRDVSDWVQITCQPIVICAPLPRGARVTDAEIQDRLTRCYSRLGVDHFIVQGNGPSSFSTTATRVSCSLLRDALLDSGWSAVRVLMYGGKIPVSDCARLVHRIWGAQTGEQHHDLELDIGVNIYPGPPGFIPLATVLDSVGKVFPMVSFAASAANAGSCSIKTVPGLPNVKEVKLYPTVVHALKQGSKAAWNQFPTCISSLKSRNSALAR
jgi:hypothetical protein